jgi:hypothetical protein
VKLHGIAHQAQIAGIRFLLINSVSKGALKTEAPAVEFFSLLGIGNVKNGDRNF